MPNCRPSKELQPIHAEVIKVAGRWMVESTGDWLLQVGDGVPGRKLWLHPGDVLHLTESGVTLDLRAKRCSPTESSVRWIPAG